MLHKSFFACALCLLLGAASLAAADRTPASPSAAEAASDLTPATSSALVTTVLELPADCVRPQKPTASFDPDVCSPTCGATRCQGKAVYSSCGLSPEPRTCTPVQACTDGPACYCVIDI